MNTRKRLLRRYVLCLPTAIASGAVFAYAGGLPRWLPGKLRRWHTEVHIWFAEHVYPIEPWHYSVLLVSGAALLLCLRVRALGRCRQGQRDATQEASRADR